jgi:opacity protein-like surface antigen
MTIRKLACLALALLISAPAFAATHKHQNVTQADSSDLGTYSTVTPNTLGFMVGPEIANRNVSLAAGTVQPTSTRTRAMIGVYYERQMMRYFTLRPEVNYVQRGWSFTQGQTSTDMAANYLEIPIHAKGQLPLGVVTPFVLTGPYIGLLMGNGKSVSTIGAQSQDTSTDGMFNTFSFGWNFGGGVDFDLGKHVVLDFTARYSLGLSNVAQFATSGDSEKLNSVQVLAGLAYEF